MGADLTLLMLVMRSRPISGVQCSGRGCSKNPAGAHQQWGAAACSVSLCVGVSPCTLCCIGQQAQTRGTLLLRCDNQRCRAGSLWHEPLTNACDQPCWLCQSQAGFPPAAAAALCMACSADPTAALLPALHEQNVCCLRMSSRRTMQEFAGSSGPIGSQQHTSALSASATTISASLCRGTSLERMHFPH